MNDYLKYLFIFNWFLPFSMLRLPTEINVFNTNRLYCSLERNLAGQIREPSITRFVDNPVDTIHNSRRATVSTDSKSIIFRG